MLLAGIIPGAWWLNEAGILSVGEAGYTDSEGTAVRQAHTEAQQSDGGLTRPPQFPPPLEGSATVEQRTVNAPVEGSSPSLPATLSDGAAAAESYPSATPAPLKETGETLNLREILSEAGWPVELHEEALAVIRCESNFSPGAIGDSGNSLGLFQLNTMWFGYAGEDIGQWASPLVNARTAWAVYQYDIGRGAQPWQQWTCKP